MSRLFARMASDGYRRPEKERKQQTNLRLTGTAKKLLDTLAAMRGISQADVMELLIRHEAKREGIYP